MEDVYTRIFQGKILLVYGASGTGKSSLIACGLGNKFEDTDWLPISIRRGLNINESLHQQVGKLMITPIQSEGPSLIKMLKSVYLDHFKPIYIVVDQFEELFIFGDREEWSEFIKAVRQVLDSSLQVRFVFIIRGEYLEYLTDFEETLPEIFSNRVRIERMTRTNAVNCITGPCKAFGIQVEDHFPETLLTKLSPGKTEIELTYLQVFLDRIFRKAKAKGKDPIVFDTKLLEELGNVGDVLSQFLDEQIELIPDSDKALAVLKAFVSTDATKKQITAPQAAEFVKTIGQDLGEKQVDRLIQELVNRRILKDKDEAGRYEFRHDSIAAKMFEKITSYERDLIEVNQFLTYAFNEHERRAFLLNESDLAYIAPYESKLNPSNKLRSFIEKSKVSARKKRIGRKRIIATVAVVSLLLVFSIIATVYAFVQTIVAQKAQREALAQKKQAETQHLLAEEQRSLAEEQRSLAEQQRLEAESQRLLSNQLQLKAQAGEKSALEEKARAEAARQEALQLRFQAELDARKIREQSVVVLREKNRADSLRIIANLETKKTDTLRMLSVAQTLSIKAAQVPDIRVKGNLALLAYVLNRDYRGYPYNPDIYDVLYESLRARTGIEFNSLKVFPKSSGRSVVSNSNSVYSCSNDGTIMRMKIVNDSIRIDKRIVWNEVGLNKILVDKTDKLLIAADQIGTITIYSAESGETIHQFKNVMPLGVRFVEMAISPTNKGAIFSNGNTLHYIDLQDLSIRRIWKSDNDINSFAFDNMDNIYASLKGGDVIKLSNDTYSPSVLRRLPSHNPIRLVISPDGEYLATSTEGGFVFVFSLTKKSTDFGFKAPAVSLDFSYDSKFLAIPTAEELVLIFNMDYQTEKPIVLRNFESAVLSSCFTFQNYIITSDNSGYVKMFPLQLDLLSKDFCRFFSPQLNESEWRQFVGRDLPFRNICNPK